MSRIYVVGIGPGVRSMMTSQAKEVLDGCDVIVGYRSYIDLIRQDYPEKEFYENGMRGEIERCEKCLQFALEGRTTALICSGDAGVYGMASPMLEVAHKNGFYDVEVIPGVTAAVSGAAVLGAPLGHDFCVISLSDLLTPWNLIEKRLICAVEGDFCIALYNPASHKRADYLKRACLLLKTKIRGTTPCGYVRNIGRDACSVKVCTLDELTEESVDMSVTVFIGNSMTRIGHGRLITPRGYLV